jgi:hypothetical protein
MPLPRTSGTGPGSSSFQLPRTLFGVGFEPTLNAMAVVRTCATRFFELKRRRVL